MRKLKGTSSHKEVTGTGDKRDEIVREAFHVFYKEGFHAAGVDRALAGTGISKRTLYKYFSSKEDLIQATIAYYGQQQSQIIRDHFAKSNARNPIDRALSIFDWLSEVVESGHVYGCYATNAKVEYTKKCPKIEAACDTHFSRFEILFVKLCKDCGARNVKKTASQLRIVFQGAIMAAQLNRDVAAVKNAKAVARLVLENAA